MSSDLIEVSGIRAFGYHGVLADEQRDGQEFIIDVALRLDTRAAARSDDLMATVNYNAVAEEIVAAVGRERFDLIETLAEYLSQQVLLNPKVEEVTITVHKPAAPITVPFGDVKVRITRVQGGPQVMIPREQPAAQSAVPADMPPVPLPSPEPEALPQLVPDPVAQHDPLDTAPTIPTHVVLALGGNLGDAIGTLRQAIRELSTVDEFAVTGVGPLARTAAVGGPEGQPDYYNTVITASTTLSPRALLNITQGIEVAYGRTREVHWGPRTLDIDIIVFGDLITMAEDLELPHSRAHQRAFVLLPWAHIDHTAVLPGLGGGPVEMLAKTAPDAAGIKSLALDWFATETLPSPDFAGVGDAQPAVSGAIGVVNYGDGNPQVPQ
ncbi:dihydroneopterin aldolase / 2-amino-4-hydroxy-6-hydroxymethyldihydropteridine diphosphokinase [Micrococcales bacterium KH10]|nr:dihydroneopterin aldolase / 2-amino-4-hydroxy-6-hydroxymethyldihydropteridine diphosphokinase [Micrococcales bacterium KH10]